MTIALLLNSRPHLSRRPISIASLGHFTSADCCLHGYRRSKIIPPLSTSSGGPLEGSGFCQGVLAGVRHEGLVTDGNGPDDDLFLAINFGGNCVARQRGRQVVLRDGDGVLMTREDTGWTITRPESSGFIGLKMSRPAVAPLIRSIDDAVMRPIPRGSNSFGLLTRYLEIIIDDDVLSKAELRPVVVSQVYDLAALALGGMGAAPISSVRAARAVPGMTESGGIPF